MAYFATNQPRDEGGDPADGMRAMFGPLHVDQEIRQAISMCWMALPADQRTADRVEAEIRRVVERALKDLKEDAGSFGIGLTPKA